MVSADYPLGIDCGFPQEGVDFVGAREAHVEFAAIRVGQGIWPDPDFEVLWSEAKTEKILRLGYMVYQPGVTGINQSRTYCDSMPANDRGELMPALDLEKNPVDWNQLYAMVTAIEQFDGREMMIYSGAWFLNGISVPAWIQAKPHWLVGYNDTGPTPLKGYSPEIICWQQTSSWNVAWVGLT